MELPLWGTVKMVLIGLFWFYPVEAQSVTILPPPEPPITVQTTATQAADTRVLPPQASTEATMNRIAGCESHNVATATNPNSSAKGRFQFLDGTWNHYAKEYWGASSTEHNVFDYEDNTKLAMYVGKTYGYTDWIASYSCWGLD